MAFFESTSSERRGLIILSVALLLMLAVGMLHYAFFRSDGREGSDGKDGIEGRQGSPRYYAVPERKVETFDFDPNEADSTTLLRLGFSPAQVRGIYRYRAMGGRYHEPADVQHIPGMTNELWDRLSSHIRIGRKYQYVKPMPYRHDAGQTTEVAESYNRDTLRFPLKLREGQTISLNDADTTLLKKIPGIGSYFSRRIVYYRKQLGGFSSARQLLEIEGIPVDVVRWVSVDTSQVQKIDVNHATKSELVRHPYLHVYRADDIWQYRHNFGPLRSIDDLRQLPNFTAEDIERLRPYLEFK